MIKTIQPTKRAPGWLGVDLDVPIRLVRGLPRYLSDLQALRRQRKGDTDFPFGRFVPCLGERDAPSGIAGGHYFHQDLWVARRVFQNAPQRHVDAGSRVDGFVAHVASFRTIEVIDIRKQTKSIPSISFVQADLMKDVGNELRDYCDSLSCLHALEHFGLGRYGDSVNYHGHLDGLRNLTRILRPGGKLYLSVPIGPQRIEFNAHRVFALGYLLAILRDAFEVDQFSYVDDKDDLHTDVSVNHHDAEISFGCSYGCGILEMTKRTR